MTPRLEAVTPGNFDSAVAIRVRPDQEHAVSPVVQSLAEAYAHPPGVAWPRPDPAASGPLGRPDAEPGRPRGGVRSARPPRC